MHRVVHLLYNTYSLFSIGMHLNCHLIALLDMKFLSYTFLSKEEWNSIKSITTIERQRISNEHISSYFPATKEFFIFDRKFLTTNNVFRGKKRTTADYKDLANVIRHVGLSIYITRNQTGVSAAG